MTHEKIVAGTGYGVCDEYSPLRRVLVRRPGSEFTNMEQYRLWGYSGEPDLAQAQVEHDAFTAILKREGVEVIDQEQVHPKKREPLFTHDASIMTPKGAILCRSGNPLRRGEEEYASKAFEALGIPVFFAVNGDGTVDGGDTLWLDPDTFLVGHSYRTNHEGYRQLRSAMEGVVARRVIQVPLPHHIGPSHVLHLMSVISPVDRDLAVVYPRLAPIVLLELLDERGIRWVEVPDEEFESMGPNVLAISPRNVVIHSGNPVTKSRLEDHGCHVHEYTGEQISMIPCGGPTCLTRPILRG
ncbi:MAG: amidinotransferase [Firmicutes bacterium]|nr:amidinotransferase [Bacillota bacterium]